MLIIKTDRNRALRGVAYIVFTIAIFTSMFYDPFFKLTYNLQYLVPILLLTNIPWFLLNFTTLVDSPKKKKKKKTEEADFDLSPGESPVAFIIFGVLAIIILLLIPFVSYTDGFGGTEPSTFRTDCEAYFFIVMPVIIFAFEWQVQYNKECKSDYNKVLKKVHEEVKGYKCSDETKAQIINCTLSPWKNSNYNIFPPKVILAGALVLFLPNALKRLVIWASHYSGENMVNCMLFIALLIICPFIVIGSLYFILYPIHCFKLLKKYLAKTLNGYIKNYKEAYKEANNDPT